MSVTAGQRMENSILGEKFVNVFICVHLLFRHVNVEFKTRVGRISVQMKKTGNKKTCSSLVYWYCFLISLQWHKNQRCNFRLSASEFRVYVLWVSKTPGAPPSLSTVSICNPTKIRLNITVLLTCLVESFLKYTFSSIETMLLGRA